MTLLVELKTPTGETVFINPALVTMLKDKDDVTHVHFSVDGSSSSFCAIHLPIRDVAELLSQG